MTTTQTAIAGLAIEPCELAYLGLRFQGGAVRAAEIDEPPIRWAIVLTSLDEPPQVLSVHDSKEEAEDRAKEIMSQATGGHWEKAPEGKRQ